MKWLSYIWAVIRSLAGFGSDTHDATIKQAGKDAQKVDDAAAVQAEITDAKKVENDTAKLAPGSALEQLRRGWQRPDIDTNL